MIDKKGLLFGKVSIVDIIVVIFISLVAIFFIQTRKNVTLVKEVEENMKMKFYATTAVERAADAMKEGQMAIDSQKNVEFGKIISVERNESRDYAFNEEGKVMKSGRIGFKEILIEVEGKGVLNEDGVMLKGNNYSIGSSVALASGDAILWLYVSDIQKSE